MTDYLSMVASTPSTHLLLELSYSLVKLAFFILVFPFEEKSIPHEHTEIWTLRNQCQ